MTTESLNPMADATKSATQGLLKYIDENIENYDWLAIHTNDDKTAERFIGKAEAFRVFRSEIKNRFAFAGI